MLSASQLSRSRRLIRRYFFFFGFFFSFRMLVPFATESPPLANGLGDSPGNYRYRRPEPRISTFTLTVGPRPDTFVDAMGTTTTPPARMRRWTRLEYERLIDLGVFESGERLELIDGRLLVREPQGHRHAATIRRVLDALRRALGDHWQIDSQLPIALDDASEPEPDVAVVPRDPGAYRDAHPSRALLIVEVAETSYRIDHEYKASLYARAGVPEYWVVDLAHQTLEVHRRPEASSAALYGWRYSSVDLLRPPASVIPLLASAPIRVADLLP